MKKAVVLLSGGMDSATALWWAKSAGWRCEAIGFDYGQRHRREIAAARALARAARVPFRCVRFRLPWSAFSVLTRRNGGIPSHRPEKIGRGPIPPTYVPGRNTIFISFGLSAADAAGAEAVVIGANALDFSGYPDCRPAYYRAWQKVARLGTKAGAEEKRPIRILAPLVRLSKAEIVRLGEKLGVPWELTWSCYRGGRRPCGRCDACRLREKGFREAGIPDPLHPKNYNSIIKL